MSNLSQFFTSAAASGGGTPSGQAVSSVMQIISSSTDVTIPSSATYIGYGALGAGGPGHFTCIACYALLPPGIPACPAPTAPREFPALWQSELGCPGANFAPQPTTCNPVFLATAGAGGGFAWKENSVSNPTDTTLTVEVGVQSTCPVLRSALSVYDYINHGSTCISGPGFCTIIGGGSNTSIVLGSRGGIGSGGDINSHGGNSDRICVPNLDSYPQFPGSAWCFAEGTGAGGTWGPGRPNCAGLSFTGGGVGEPGIIGRAGLLAHTCVFTTLYPPNQFTCGPCTGQRFYYQKPEPGFITQHTIDGRISQGKTLFAAAGGGAAYNNIARNDHCPIVVPQLRDGTPYPASGFSQAIASSREAGVAGGAGAGGMSGFGAGAGDGVVCKSGSITRAHGRAGCGGGGSLYVQSPFVAQNGSNPTSVCTGGDGVAVIEYWTTD